MKHKYLCLQIYKYSIAGNFGNSDTDDLLLHIVQCWSACAVDEDNCYLTMVLYWSGIILKYYLRLGFLPIKHNEEGKDIRN